MICLFTAGLIKTVMCRELFRRQSMHFDLESQIESHPTLAAPRAAQALENIGCLPPPASLDLGEFPAGQAALRIPRDLKVRISGQIEAFRVRSLKGWMLRALLVAGG